ncbi:helix-turn-helix transcriptional regulator [Salinirussus salinus]|uniref:helix-turn-helix transcriptional regulator n=1 Tax=Salinirussus salinus TaxID=1198300 RepID=UPI001356A753|nr:helix-turn-helix domain-containing protein [Salinirussus salinus]
MGEREDGTMEDALKEIAYLTRSPNRVRILDCLAEGPRTRREAKEASGATRTTVDRIVNELEDRGWVERTTDGNYAATPVGRQLVRELTPLVRAVEAIQELGSAVEWLPLDELSVGLQDFADATVRRPDRGDPVDTIDYMTDLVREASELRALTHLVPPESFLRVTHDAIVSGQLRLEGVVPTDHVEPYIETQRRRERWQAILEAGGELHLHEAALPCNMWIIDETVLIKRSDPGRMEDSYGVPVVTTDGTVRDAAHDLIDRYRDAGTQVGPGAFDVLADEPETS